MRLFFIILSFNLIGLSDLTSQSIVIDNPEEWDAREEKLRKWFDDLYVFGVEVKGDSISIQEDVIKLFEDSAYYALVFPNPYSWEMTVAALKAMDFKKAFWYLINLYHTDPDKNRELVLRTILSFKNLLELERLLLSSFYTYAYFSPEHSTLINGKLNVHRPDIIEKKMNTLKIMVQEVKHYSKN